MTTPGQLEVRADIVVVGDGPAGSALASALQRREVDVVLVGDDAPWSATYGTWTDDVDSSELIDGAAVWRHRFSSIRAHFGRPRTIHRPYGVVDNVVLRATLRSGVTRHLGRVGLDQIDARVIIDATGWPSGLQSGDESAADVGWQTAIGVVLTEPPDGSLGQPMLMDFSLDGSDDVDVPSFAYALPVDDGWLVEETVLVAAPAIDPDRLIARLARRLTTTPERLLADAVRVERVRIPMGASATPAVGNLVRYGAAAGMINPTTGYSLATSICSAPAVAERLVEVLRSGDVSPERLGAGVWPTAARRTRALHDYGLDVVSGLGVDDLRRFFDAFFDLPEERWAGYLRIDTPPARLAATMLAMFRGADWPLRRRLVTADPRHFLHLIS